MLIGTHWGSLGVQLGSSTAHWGTLEVQLEPIGVQLGCNWASWGSSGGAQEQLMG